ncbi:hypothetical protein MWU53_10170 [Aliiroseovarius sp. S1123]|uniref:hypothetical protein n=1 Tax=Aliiroseovarius sp. S1123 TaxID=2926404 RepID=UPI001FF6536B|nr:hypothetical protein [Aliiroseovarius sp. S1123]MCK0171422.1 hypothetical protein [Aliiroseovarius sp. S1123]
MTLFEATRDQHHACEQHPLGRRMAAGNITRAEWAAWLNAFRTLHQVVDLALPADMQRDTLLAADLSVLPSVPPSRAALRFALDLCGVDTTGAAYVLHGAHRSGGRVLAPTLVKRGLPCAHITYRDPEAVQAWVKQTRGRDDLASQARATFACLLAVMDEIIAREDLAAPVAEVESQQ